MIGLTPKYMTLVRELERLIESLGSNELIPSERELAVRYNLSRMTVRKAIDYLVAQRKLYRVKKVGTFTTDERLYKHMHHFKGFTKEVEAAGGKASNRLIEYTLKPAVQPLATYLGIQEKDLVYRVVRLRMKNDTPIFIDESHFPKNIVPLDEEIVEGSIYDYIRNTLGHSIMTARQRFRATFPKEEYQHYLEVDAWTPVMHVETIAHLEDGRIFEYTNSYIDTQRYELVSTSYQD